MRQNATREEGELSTSPRILCGALALAAAAATAAVALVPVLSFAYERPALRVALETAIALVALLAAYLVLGRVRRTRRLDELWLASGLLALAAANLVLALRVSVVPGWDGGRAFTWAGTITGALLLAVAAFARDSRPIRGLRWPLLVLLGAVGLWAVADLALAAFVLDGTGGGTLVADPRRPSLSGRPEVLTVQAVQVAALGLAAVGFARKAERRADDLLLWVALGVVLAAFGRFAYLLFPPVQTTTVYVGDVFRLLFSLVLVVGAVREIERYWQGLAGAAVLEERRRMARDLHDGVAQELAYIDRAARRLAGGAREGAARQIAAAAGRGLADSRRAIAALTRPLDEPLERVLVEATDDVAARSGLVISYDLAEGIAVGADAREALLRIACEAVTNAAHHAHASGVRIELTNGATIRMRVVDDGVGFEPDVLAHRGGFGLVSMQERAQAIGGRLRIESRPGGGTSVEVEL